MKRIALAAAAPFVLAACIGTDVGNPPATTELGFEPTTEAESETVTGALSLPNDYTVEEAWIAVDYATLRDAENCERSGDTDAIGPFFVDLANGGQVYPRPPLFRTSSGEACQLKIELAPAVDVPAESGAPFALRGHSIYVRGTRPDGSLFAIASDREETIRYKPEADESISIEPGSNRLVSVFDTAGWTSLIEFDQLDDEPVEISPRSNPRQYQEFRKNFLQGSALYRDENLDGELSPGEQGKAVGRPDFVDGLVD